MPDDRQQHGSVAVKHFILATAGHVDHGKTALVRALTGVDTDRLPEEKARGITIELGFAHLSLLGFSIGVIDVPGHEDFIRNMIAGVGAVDLALLVVAADDGWMPQTEEHLQILTYLGVKRAVVALTKSDLGDAAARSREIRRQLQDSPFAQAEIVPTSVVAQTGLAELKSALTREFAQLPRPRDFGKPRLFVDRVFSVHGSGTVVTGTLSGGCFKRDDKVVAQTQNLSARIRGLQSHSQSLESAGPRRRLALNLVDLNPGQVPRGSIVHLASDPARISRCLDVLLVRSARLPAGARPMRNGLTCNFHFGSTRLRARLQLRDRGELLPNESAIARLRLEQPVCALLGDRFILRDSSERQTVAGGLVLDGLPGAMKFRSPRQRQLLDRRVAAPNDLRTLLRTQLERDRFAPRLDLLSNAPFSKEEIAAALESLGASGQIFLEGKIAADSGWWKLLREKGTRLIETEHADHPERAGLELNRLREALQITETDDLFDALVGALARGGYRQEGNVLRRESFRPSLPVHLQAAGDRIRATLRARPLDPPSRKELAPDEPATQALRFLCASGEVVLVSDELAMSTDGIATMKAAIEEQLRGGKSATVSELRQATGTTRRVIVPLLEYFDRTGLTRRTGDRRSLT